MQKDEYRAMFELEDRLWWYTGMRAITAAILDKRLPIGPFRLLDAGCGTGFSLAWMKQRYPNAEGFGVDVSLDASRFWSRRNLDTVALAPVESLPFASNEFDLVTCFDVIYQLTVDEARRAVAEMQRVLRPGGLLLIREPAYNWMRGAHDLAIGTRHRYTKKRLCALLREQGFSIKRATYANTLLFAAAAAHRLASRLTRRAESDVKPVGGFLNRAFESALKLEARLLRHIRFPFGLSVIALAEKITR
ncbi:MAG: class I SAM-dependent methyltransferase [Acidobacteriota bacterium]